EVAAVSLRCGLVFLARAGSTREVTRLDRLQQLQWARATPLSLCNTCNRLTLRSTSRLNKTRHYGDDSCQSGHYESGCFLRAGNSRRAERWPLCANRYRLARGHGNLAAALAVPRVWRDRCICCSACPAGRSFDLNNCRGAYRSAVGAPARARLLQR